jgi:hypothetical protein
MFIAVIATAITLGALSWNSAQAASNPVANTSALQQTMPMTNTMLMTNTMPMTGAMPGVTDGAPGAMPMQPGTGQPGMVQMMTHMAKMQGMMAKMQRMMAGGMMSAGAPMTGTMPMAGMMQGDMGEMMDMMSEMQGMMADMQGMMAGEMGKGMGADGMSGMGQMQGQQMGAGMMQGGMMGQMPMMGTMIMVMPMPMMQGGMMQNGMMQGMDMGKMMGQMPMMQGMDMGGMMGGQGGAQGNGPAAAGKPINAAATPQTGKLGEIEVKVTPPDLTNIQGETVDFTVDLNATGADLSFDLAPMATLLIGDHKMPAEAWKVTLDHGHHVAGVLKFPAHMQGAVEGATIVFADPTSGVELSLTWTTAQ